MAEVKEFWGSIKTQRSFKSKGGGLIVQVEVSDKDLATFFATHEDVDFKFTLEQGKRPVASTEDPAQMTLDALEE